MSDGTILWIKFELYEYLVREWSGRMRDRGKGESRGEQIS